MKPYSEWKLSASEIHNACNKLTEFISAVVLASEPFKVKATLIKASSSSANVEVDGVSYWINQSYCYFGIQQQEPGAEVYVDNRYLQTI